MYRMYRAVSQLSTVAHLSTPASRVTQTPRWQPARFFTQSPPPSPSPDEIELALRTAIKGRRLVELMQLIKKFSMGYVGTDSYAGELKLNKTELHTIDLVMERIRSKYGLRCLSVDDDWETVYVVTNPEGAVQDEVEKGKRLQDALIYTVKHMVPKASCQSIEDVERMISIHAPDASEINKMPKWDSNSRPMLDSKYMLDEVYFRKRVLREKDTTEPESSIKPK